ncbi:MAG TPA: hypothetical protein VF469_36325 [Kofleriaceae bacterium]
MLEDPWREPDPAMFQRTRDPRDAPDTPRILELELEHGDVVALDGERLAPVEMLARLNAIAGEHGVGRVDLVENRFVGMKSRGVFETAGGTVLHAARAAVESLTPRSRAAPAAPGPHAALRCAGLQRLLVRARARGAAEAGRRHRPGDHRHRPDQAVQGRADRARRARRRTACTAPTS